MLITILGRFLQVAGVLAGIYYFWLCEEFVRASLGTGYFSWFGFLTSGALMVVTAFVPFMLGT